MGQAHSHATDQAKIQRLTEQLQAMKMEHETVGQAPEKGWVTVEVENGQ